MYEWIPDFMVVLVVMVITKREKQVIKPQICSMIFKYILNQCQFHKAKWSSSFQNQTCLILKCLNINIDISDNKFRLNCFKHKFKDYRGYGV